ncbi:MAG: hypothetical protein LBG78_10610 [Azoarcus sp.]|nr:hypothetical protein [Azoarcus sp.]
MTPQGVCAEADSNAPAKATCGCRPLSPVKPSRNARHCERSEAIHAAAIPAILDCFVASLLAMTGRDLG